MLKVIAFLSAVMDFINRLTDSYMRRKDREAGRNEAVLEQWNKNDAAIDDAEEARRRARERDASPDGLRENDGFRRD